MVGFDMDDMRNALKDSQIIKAELYLHNQHSWYFAGAKASIIEHNADDRPNKFSFTRTMKEVPFTGRGQGKWIDIGNSFAEKLRDGTASGFGLFKNSTNVDYYGYWYGTDGNEGQTPKIRITYRK